MSIGNVSPSAAESELHKKSESVGTENLKQVTRPDAQDKLKVMSRKPALAKFKEQISLMIKMVNCYVHGEYDQVAWKTIAAIVGALIYVLSPVDLVPDVIPFAGLVDDAAVVACALKLVGMDITAFANWLAARKSAGKQESANMGGENHE